MDGSTSAHTVRLHLTVPAGAAAVGPRADAVLSLVNAESLALDSS
jgi:hypothetical protein